MQCCVFLYRREHATSHRAALLDACQTEDSFDACKRVVSCPPNSLTAAVHTPSGGHCLLVSTIGPLCKANAAVATRLWADAWPALSAADVADTLLGADSSTAPARAPARATTSAASLSWQRQAHVLYLQYLEALLASSRDDISVVLFVDEDALRRAEQALGKFQEEEYDEGILMRIVDICRRLLSGGSRHERIMGVMATVIERTLRRVVSKGDDESSTTLLEPCECGGQQESRQKSEYEKRSSWHRCKPY